MPIKVAKRQAQMKSSGRFRRRFPTPMSYPQRDCLATLITSISLRKVTSNSESVMLRRCCCSWDTSSTNPCRQRFEAPECRSLLVVHILLDRTFRNGLQQRAKKVVRNFDCRYFHNAHRVVQ